MKKLFKIKKGFTLAEILIALTVIGVVAAITIHVLFNSASDAEYKNKLKKEYSVLAQAVAMASQANGGTFDAITKHQWANGFGQTLQPYLKYSKSCNLGIPALGETAGLPVMGNCWTNSTYAKQLNGLAGGAGTSIIITDALYSGFVLNDGTFLIIRSIRRYCSDTQVCAITAIDINGFKGPNTQGKDVYYITIRPNSIMVAQDGDAVNFLPTIPNCTANGVSCASHYLHE